MKTEKAIKKQKASRQIRYYRNENGPVISAAVKEPIFEDGLYFRDVNGDGILTASGDWRKDPEERAADLAARLSPEEKIGLLFLSGWNMGKYQEDVRFLDETGLLDEKPIDKSSSIFSETTAAGTTETIQKKHVRQFILRTNPTAEELTDWINELNRTAEEMDTFIPMLIASNSRNENAEKIFGMNDASGEFAAWPGTLGIAAAVKGTGDIAIVDRFADCVRRDWDAVGMKKGYMYMADCVTDPRWKRTYGTFGEDPQLIQEIFEHLIPGVQGSDEGVTANGVAMTVKHFPGGGARENGFDPHYATGQWNVYPTEGSLEKYHIPGFLPAVRKKASSIMPYYAKPCRAKSAEQKDFEGNSLEWVPVGFAFNRIFLQDILRDQMKFEGYINSDSGIVQNMAWGVEELEICERVALAVNAGVDIISGSYDMEAAKEAYKRWEEGHYTCQGHPVPEGYTPEEITLSAEALNRAVTRTLTERFELGLFENPYREPEYAAEVIKDQRDWEQAMDIHRKSVVLLKNLQALPLTAEKEKLVYVEYFCRHPEEGTAAAEKEKICRILKAAGIMITENYREADAAVLFVHPVSGEFFESTKGFIELDICEEKEVRKVDEKGRPVSETYKETTVAGAGRIKEIADAVHNNGGKIFMSVNVTLAWQLGNVEPYADALVAGFDTCPEAVVDIILGAEKPVGVLPITLPRGDEVLAVDAQGNCISRNDVPGYDKDLYMPESMKDENGKAYAYRDSAGNYYEYGFGLRL